ncbi:LamB/YcsF family protein [Parapedobacter sp. ISTM3]|uniref:LamB/YcsF family protein n=1 Tax=Parapedobacter sp. ISTM3 TaxID=2800130 RepID=UPI0019043A3D|nr:5-oxoprolinase subunit PxpA [Parapedobacter sp. ISTM3]MBK1440415.1 LamB/YcsF family protein [Parapedobacter sp. ISTM3]
MTTIDLNCDIGETPGSQSNVMDELLLAYASSANIACGFHAGDPLRMQLTVQQALLRGVAIGAHPGLPDVDNFGRQERPISPDEVYQITLYQIGALSGFTKAAGATLHHVKPHGALYNMAARDINLAEALVSAIYEFDSNLVLYALAGSAMVDAAQTKGIRVATEGFMDRTYEADGLLTPRSRPGALITDTLQALKQAFTLLEKVDTLCIHGDTPHAIALARVVYHAFLQDGIAVKAPFVS